MSLFNDFEEFLINNTVEESIEISHKPSAAKEKENVLLKEYAIVLRRLYSKKLKGLVEALQEALEAGKISKELYKFIISPILDQDNLGDDTLGGGDDFGEDDVVIDDVNPNIDDTTVVDTTNPSGLDKGFIKYIIAFSKNKFDTKAERFNIENIILNSSDKISLSVSKASLSFIPEKLDSFSNIIIESKEIVKLAIEK